MSEIYYWVKSLHIVFVAGWFVGLFYLPRLLLNLAAVPADSHAERERLLVMGRKLYRWAGVMMVPAILFGLTLWMMGMGRGAGWIHAKLLLVVGAIGLHHLCRSQLRKFEQMGTRRSAGAFGAFFAVAVALFAGSTVLAVVKPF